MDKHTKTVSKELFIKALEKPAPAMSKVPADEITTLAIGEECGKGK